MGRIGFGMRFVAALIDGIILLVARWILLKPFGYTLPTNINSSNMQQVLEQAIAAAQRMALVGGILGIAYTLMEVFLATTPGKMVLKQKIVSLGGTPAPMNALLLRWALKQSPTLLTLLFGLTGVGLINILVFPAAAFVLVSCLMTLRATKLALHDDIAKTCVYGPTTDVVPSGFPVMPPGSTPPPPTA
jgi:uncharacterized RDD family membrane protein YckC